MQGGQCLYHARSLLPNTPFERHNVRNETRAVRVRDSHRGTAAARIAVPPQTKAGQIAAEIQQEAPKSQQIVLGHSKKKYVPFRPDFYSSESVQLAGSWDDWSSNIVLPTDPATGEHGIVLELDSMHGEMTYKYNVASKWHLSRADAQGSDAQGCVNNTTSGRKLVRFSFPAAYAGPRASEQSVHLIGSFTGWQAVIPMTLGADGAYHCDVSLTPGHHTFRFLLNAQMENTEVYEPMAQLITGTPQYCVLNHLPLETLPSGVQVNSLRVPAPPVFKLMFHTLCSEAWIYYKYRGRESEPLRRARMYHQPDCRGMMVVHLPAPGPDAALEFFIQAASWEAGSTLSTISSLDEEFGYGSWKNGHHKNNENIERHPPGNRMHMVPRPGSWRLKDESVQMDQASQLPPLMLCTDLDGTLIEDQGEQNDWVRQKDELTYQAAQHFAQYLAPAGGLIVYNTGRSIGMVEGLLAKKSGIMPWPAAIITAVGTKVFLFDVATRQWSPDPAYSALLDDGWNLQEVTRVATSLMKRYHDAVKCIDDGSEHPHRMSLQIRSDVLQDFIKKWSSGLTAAGVQHQMVASIGGDWRYVDCIAKNAGKGRAMVYLASKFGIALEDVVAAGDSGNDLLMLQRLPEGNHPAIVMSNSHPEVWDWLASLTPEERVWVYTPKAERAAGLVEGLKAILADKLVQQQERLQQQQRQQQRHLQPPTVPRQFRALPS